MSNEVIHTDGKDVVVREDTAKAFRFFRFETIVLGGIILIFIAAMLFFSGLLTQVDVSPGTANAPVSNSRANP
jgi:hypothetical protein